MIIKKSTLGPVITWRGAYNNSTPYNKNDAVSYGGSSYICILATIGNYPRVTTYWSPLALKGDTGDQGPQGDPTTPAQLLTLMREWRAEERDVFCGLISENCID